MARGWRDPVCRVQGQEYPLDTALIKTGQAGELAYADWLFLDDTLEHGQRIEGGIDALDPFHDGSLPVDLSSSLVTKRRISFPVSVRGTSAMFTAAQSEDGSARGTCTVSGASFTASVPLPGLMHSSSIAPLAST